MYNEYLNKAHWVLPGYLAERSQKNACVDMFYRMSRTAPAHAILEGSGNLMQAGPDNEGRPDTHPHASVAFSKKMRLEKISRALSNFLVLTCYENKGKVSFFS